MPSSSRQSENIATQKTLLSDYISAPIAEARQRQDDIMLARFQGKPLRIADLGCGDGYHGSLFGADCELYHGYEFASGLASIARERWRKENLTKNTLIEADLADVPVEQSFYDLVICMYFTPGNFRDVYEDLSRYTDDYLDHNPVFGNIVARFHKALRRDGKMFLTVYKDLPETESAQFDFYLNTGQRPITPRGLRFVATAEGFWSARWTKASMLSNLADAGISRDAVQFHDLNAIAWLVEITK